MIIEKDCTKCPIKNCQFACESKNCRLLIEIYNQGYNDALIQNNKNKKQE